MRENLIERLNRVAKKFRGTLAGNLYAQAAAALEAAREDAERYRWLRDRHDRTHQDWHVRDQWNNAPAIGDLDAAIDQARGKGGGEVEGGR